MWNKFKKAQVLNFAPAQAHGSPPNITTTLPCFTQLPKVMESDLSNLCIAGAKFRDGFLGAFASSVIAGPLKGLVKGTKAAAIMARTAIAAVVGGTVSKLTGGKFANGAVTAAFVHLFNAEMGDRIKRGWRSFKAGVESVFNHAKVTIGHTVAFHYSGACSAMTGSSECAAVYQIVRDDAGRIGGALFDYFNDDQIRSEVNDAIFKAWGYAQGSDFAQGYVTGRYAASFGISQLGGVYGKAFVAFLVVPGSALRASQVAGDGLHMGHIVTEMGGSD